MFPPFLPRVHVEVGHLALLPLQAAEPHVRLVPGQLHRDPHGVRDRLERLDALVLRADHHGQVVEEAQVCRAVHVKVTAVEGAFGLKKD